VLVAFQASAVFGKCEEQCRGARTSYKGNDLFLYHIILYKIRTGVFNGNRDQMWFDLIFMNVLKFNIHKNNVLL